MTYMDVHQLSEYLGGIPINTLRKWCSNKKIPYIKIPGSSHVRFQQEEIDQWMLKGRIGDGESVSA